MDPSPMMSGLDMDVDASQMGHMSQGNPVSSGMPQKPVPAVPSLSLSFANDPHPIESMQAPDTDSPRNSPRGGSGGRRSGSRDRRHYSPYPMSSSPRGRLASNESPLNSPALSSPTTNGTNPSYAMGTHYSSPNQPSMSPSVGPSVPHDIPGGDEEPKGRHRRTNSDPRNFNREVLMGDVSTARSTPDDIKYGMAMDQDHSQSAFLPPKSPRAIHAEGGPSDPNAMDDGRSFPKHRRSHSDSSSMKIFPSADGFRLIIPPQTLKSLRDMDATDQSVTVLLAPEPQQGGQVNVFRNVAAGEPMTMAQAKASTRPKHYKCSKCGQLKKGHVCEYAQDKPARSVKGERGTYNASPSTMGSMMMQQRGNGGGLSPHTSPHDRLNYHSPKTSPNNPQGAGQFGNPTNPIHQARAQLEQSSMMQGFGSAPGAESLSLQALLSQRQDGGGASRGITAPSMAPTSTSMFGGVDMSSHDGGFLEHMTGHDQFLGEPDLNPPLSVGFDSSSQFGGSVLPPQPGFDMFLKSESMDD